MAFIDQMLTDLVPLTLHADQYMISSGGGSMVQVLFDILLGFGVPLYHCMVRLQGAEEEQVQFRKRVTNTVIFFYYGT